MIDTLVGHLHAPLMVIGPERRRAENASRRDLFRRSGVDGPFDMTETDEKNGVSILPVVSFLKLVGIVATAVTPFMLVNWLLIQGAISKSESNFIEKADSRYVKEDIAKIRREEISGRLQDLRIKNDEEDARLSRIEAEQRTLDMKLEQLDEQIKQARQQARQGGR